MKILYKGLYIFLMFVFISNTLQAQNWKVPEIAKSKKNPYQQTILNASKGKKLYTLNCKSCHGEPGKSNQMQLNPLPTDLGSSALLKQTNGELYYKINLGMGLMPSFKKSLFQENKWHIINYIRSFDKNKQKQITSNIVNAKLPKLNSVSIELTINEEESTILAKLTGKDKKGLSINIPNIELSCLVQRAFGKLNVVGEFATTDENGELFIQFPKDLPGTREGYIDLTVKVSDDDLFGLTQVQRIAQIGQISIHENPLDKRSMWGTSDKAPLWIIFGYLFSFIGVWSVIFYAIYQTFQLKKLASKE